MSVKVEAPNPEDLQQTPKHRRWFAFVAGALLIAFGVSSIIFSGVGAGTFDAFLVGVMNLTGLGIAVVGLSAGAILLGVSFALGYRAGLGVLIMFILFSPALEAYFYILGLAHEIGQPPNMYVAVGEFTVGLLSLCIGVSFVIQAKLGVGAFEAITIVLSDRLGISIPKARLIIEVCSAIAAFLIGGPIGVGTVILVFAIPAGLKVFLPVAERAIYRGTPGLVTEGASAR